MTKISAIIVADSINEYGNRVTTMKLVLPRMILSELNTHRSFSRNTSSSRAVPFEKMVEAVKNDPFIPISWQKSHSGMQGTEYFTRSEDITRNEQDWLSARDESVVTANTLHLTGVTKQLCNRLLEPFMWTTVLLTATEFSNFFDLRCPSYEVGLGNYKYKSRKDFINAQGQQFANKTDVEWLSINKGQSEIHMMALAESMYDALNESVPEKLKMGDWHIPYKPEWNETDSIFELLGIKPLVKQRSKTDNDEFDATCLKISVARAARISYTVMGDDEKVVSHERNIKLYDQLLSSKHFSPFEHQCRAMNQYEITENNGFSANFKGFVQYRHTLPTISSN